MSQKHLCLSLKESKSHMLSILNFASSVTHRAVFYATLIAPIAGTICHFCLFGNFCFLLKSHPSLLFVVFAFAFHTSKKIVPFYLFAYFAFYPRQCCNTLQNSTTGETGSQGKVLQIIFKQALSAVELL